MQMSEQTQVTLKRFFHPSVIIAFPKDSETHQALIPLMEAGYIVVKDALTWSGGLLAQLTHDGIEYLSEFFDFGFSVDSVPSLRQIRNVLWNYTYPTTRKGQRRYRLLRHVKDMINVDNKTLLYLWREGYLAQVGSWDGTRYRLTMQGQETLRTWFF